MISRIPEFRPSPRWIGLYLLVGLFCLSEPIRAAGSITVSEAYGRALRLYSQGRLKGAFQIATATIRHYPDHQPSYLLAGQILYRIGKLDRASRFFRKVSPDMLSGEIAYIYGVTFFSVGNCSLAEEGFSRVTVASPVGKLAAFYRGICLARGRSWTAAEKQLLVATPIPPHLETVRRRALDQVRTALNTERTAPPLTNIQYIYVQAPPLYYAPQGQPSPNGNPPPSIYQPKKKTPPSPVPPAGFTGAVTPNGEIRQTQFARDYTGSKRENGTEQTLSGKLALLGRYNAQGNVGGGQPYAQVAAEAGLTSVETKGKSTALVAYEDAPDTQEVKETALPPGKRDTQRIAVNPEASYPILGLIDATLGGRWIDTSITGTVTDKFTRQEEYASIGFGVNTQLKGSGTLVQKMDKDGTNVENATLFAGQLTHIVGPATITLSGQYAIRTMVKKPEPGPGLVTFQDEGGSQFDGTILSGDGSARKNWDSFSLTFAGGYKAFNPSSNQYKKAQENSSFKFEVSGVKTWADYLALTITGSYTQLMEYKLEVDKPKGDSSQGTALQDSETPPPEKIIAVATGDRLQGLVALKYSPIPLISLGATYDIVRADFTPTESLLNDSVKQALPSLNTRLTFLAGIQTNF